MTDEIQSNIRVNIDTADALANLKKLQTQISEFQTQMAKADAKSAMVAGKLQSELVKSINASGKFAASFTTVKSTSEAFTQSLEKNKLSLGEYFRYAGASSKSFGKYFKQEFDTISQVAESRVRTLQTQYIKLGRDANGAMKAIKIRPLALDMDSLATKTQLAAQKQQLLNQLLKQGSTNLLNFGKNTQWAGRQLMVGFTIPLAIMGSTAVKAYTQMEQAAVKFKRVYGDISTGNADTEKALKNIQKLAQEYTKYGVAVADTMNMAADAAAMGKQGAALIAQVAQANKLSVLGGVDQQKSLQTTISLTNAFNISSKDLGKTIDFLNGVENQTVLSIDDLTTAIPKAAPIIKQLGGNVKDLAFFLTAMKEGGVNAAEGANAIKSGLSSLINPSAKASTFLKSFGVDVKGIVEQDKGNLRKTVVDFANALDTLDPLNRSRAIEQLFGKFQFARMSTLFKNVTGAGTQAAKVLDLANMTSGQLAYMSQKELKRIEQSPLFKFQKALADFQTQMAPVGEQFMKAITPIINFGTDVLKSFNNLNDGVKQFIVTATGIGLGLGPVLIMTFGLVANGVAQIIKGFALFKSFVNGATKSTDELGLKTKYMTEEQLNAAAAAASLDQAHAKLRQTFTSERVAIDQLTAAYERSVAAQNAFMNGGGGKKKTPKYASGGIFSGPGTGTSDSILARVSNGEAIIPAASVSKHRDVVQGLISGNVPGFAGGYMPYESAVVAFGAHQPFTSAHENIARMGMAMAAEQGSPFFQFSTMQGKSKRSLLSNQTKSKLIGESIGMAPELTQNPFSLMESLAAKGIKNVTLLLGEDRMSSAVFEKAAQEFGINLKKVAIPRPPGSPSGTAARLAAANGDISSFINLIAPGASQKTKEQVFHELRAGMKLPGYAKGGIFGMIKGLIGKIGSKSSGMDNVYVNFLRGRKDLAVRMRSESFLDKLRSGDLNYSNKFQDSSDAYSDEARLKVEQNLFGIPMDAPGSKRPIYGIAGSSHLPMSFRGSKATDANMFRHLYNNIGGDGLDRYGDISLILKNSVKKRSTFTLGDSYSTANFKDASNKSVPAKFGTFSRSKILAAKSQGNYKVNDFIEAQIFGGLPFTDVKKILVQDPALIPVLEEALASSGLNIPVTMRRLGITDSIKRMLFKNKKYKARNGQTYPLVYHPFSSTGEIAQYANGGILKGPGTGTSDSILARVSNGEAIIPAHSVAKHPELVNSLISGGIPGFSKGAKEGVISKLIAGFKHRDRSAPNIMQQQGKNMTYEDMQLEIEDGLKAIEEAVKQGVMDQKAAETLRIQGPQINATHKFPATEKVMIGGVETDRKIYTSKTVDPDLGFFNKGIANVIEKKIGTPGKTYATGSYIGDLLKNPEALKDMAEKHDLTVPQLRAELKKLDPNTGGGTVYPQTDKAWAAVQAVAYHAKSDKGTSREGVGQATVLEEVVRARRNRGNGKGSRATALADGTLAYDPALDAESERQSRVRLEDAQKKAEKALGKNTKALDEQSEQIDKTTQARRTSAANSGVVSDESGTPGLTKRVLKDGSTQYYYKRKKIEIDQASNMINTHLASQAASNPQSTKRVPSVKEDLGNGITRHTSVNGNVTYMQDGVGRISAANAESALAGEPSGGKKSMGSRFKSGLGKIGSRLSGGGLAIATGMAGSMIGGDAGNMLNTASMGLGIMSMLPAGALTAIAPLLPAVAGVAVAFVGLSMLIDMEKKAREREYQSIVGLGNVALVTSAQLKATGDHFQTQLGKSAFEKAKLGVSTRVGGRTAQDAVASALEDKNLMKSYQNDINALKGVSGAQATKMLKLKSLQLQAQGLSAEDANALANAIGIKAGKSGMDLSGNTISSKGMSGFAGSTTIAAGQINKVLTQGKLGVGVEGFGRGAHRVSDWTDKQKAALDTAGKTIAAQFDVIGTAFQSGELNSKEFEAQYKKMAASILKADPKAAFVAMQKVIEQLPADIKKTAMNVKGLNDQLLVVKATQSGVQLTQNQLQALVTGPGHGAYEEFTHLYVDNYTKTVNQIKAQIKAAEKLTNDMKTGLQKFQETQQKSIDKYNLALKIMSYTEDEINKKYDARVAALDKINQVNQQITQQQQNQLDLADALSKGDIAAAARAAQTYKDTLASQQFDTQKAALETARQNELKSVTYGGLTRAQTEAKIKELQKATDIATYTGVVPVTKSNGGIIPKYFATGGFAMGTDTVPAMLTPGEFVVKKSAVDRIGTSSLNSINNGTSPDSSVYNYSINVNVSSGSNPNDIANAVMRQIKNIDNQRIRGVSY